MRFPDEASAITYIFSSLHKLRLHEQGNNERALDELTRDVAPTRELLRNTGLINSQREYVVITGSKGKGSTTAITAKLLQHLGHNVGMITSPHLISYRERIRVNGRAIPEADLTRILSELAPDIDLIEAKLSDNRYFSPQGIFLAVALRWFDEQNVNVAVLEVGRGGRFDDIAVVPNQLSLFTPIMLEHPYQLGATVDRIAWHKAGIIKQFSYAYSVPQTTEILAVLEAEAQAQTAEFAWIAPMDMGRYLGHTDNGIRMELGRYGNLNVSLLGEYQTVNASLAVQGAGNVHGRLKSEIKHASPEYVSAIRDGLANVIWPGRLQQLQDEPAVYLDGAINAASAASMVRSLEGRLSDPVVAIIGVPDDKDYVGVYKEIGLISDSVIITETERNVTLHFPQEDIAVNAMRRFNDAVTHTKSLKEAVRLATGTAGTTGTVLIIGTQSIVADAMILWGFSYEQI